MPTLPITFRDLATLLRACGGLSPAECSAERLGPAIAPKLEYLDPALAEAVRRFDASEMLALCEYVRDGLLLTASVDAGEWDTRDDSSQPAAATYCG
jgi:hypothetical protein